MVKHMLPQILIVVAFTSVVHAYPDGEFSAEYSNADAGMLWSTVCDLTSGAHACYANIMACPRHQPVYSDVSNEIVLQMSGLPSSEASSWLSSQNNYSATAYSDNEAGVDNPVPRYPDGVDQDDASNPRHGGRYLNISSHSAGCRLRAGSLVEPRSVQSHLNNTYTPGDRTTEYWDGSTPVSPADVMLDPALEGQEHHPLQRPALPQQVQDYDPNCLEVPSAKNSGVRRVRSNPGSFQCPHCNRAFGRQCDLRYEQ